MIRSGGLRHDRLPLWARTRMAGTGGRPASRSGSRRHAILPGESVPGSPVSQHGLAMGPSMSRWGVGTGREVRSRSRPKARSDRVCVASGRRLGRATPAGGAGRLGIRPGRWLTLMSGAAPGGPPSLEPDRTRSEAGRRTDRAEPTRDARGRDRPEVTRGLIRFRWSSCPACLIGRVISRCPLSARLSARSDVLFPPDLFPFRPPFPPDPFRPPRNSKATPIPTPMRVVCYNEGSLTGVDPMPEKKRRTRSPSRRVTRVLEDLCSSEPSKRKRAIEGCADMAPQVGAVLAALLRGLNDPDDLVRLEASHGLLRHSRAPRSN